jgi:hypothetical protein
MNSLLLKQLTLMLTYHSKLDQSNKEMGGIFAPLFFALSNVEMKKNNALYYFLYLLLFIFILLYKEKKNNIINTTTDNQ